MTLERLKIFRLKRGPFSMVSTQPTTQHFYPIQIINPTNSTSHRAPHWTTLAQHSMESLCPPNNRTALSVSDRLSSPLLIAPCLLLLHMVFAYMQKQQQLFPRLYLLQYIDRITCHPAFLVQSPTPSLTPYLHQGHHPSSCPLNLL